MEGDKVVIGGSLHLGKPCLKSKCVHGNFWENCAYCSQSFWNEVRLLIIHPNQVIIAITLPSNMFLYFACQQEKGDEKEKRGEFEGIHESIAYQFNSTKAEVRNTF